MKIISEIPTEKILVSMTKDEFANIVGFYSHYALNGERKNIINDAIKEEREINISEIFQQHQLITELQKSDNFQEARRKLNSMLKALTVIENKVVSLPVLKDSKIKS